MFIVAFLRHLTSLSPLEDRMHRRGPRREDEQGWRDAFRLGTSELLSQKKGFSRRPRTWKTFGVLNSYLFSHTFFGGDFVSEKGMKRLFSWLNCGF